MSLIDWRNFGWLKDLFAVAPRDLQACQTPVLVSDWLFNLAYNAATRFHLVRHEFSVKIRLFGFSDSPCLPM